MTTEATSATTRDTGHGHRHLGLALALICVAQLMVVLDSTIANIALPYIKTDIGFSAANLSWVVTGYALVFGGFLLLGGRLGDLYGRRRVFMIGLTHLRGRVAARRLRAERADAARRAGPAGPGCRDRVPHRAGADHHDVPGGSAAQPRVRRLRRDVRCRRRGRPDPRRLADRAGPEPVRHRLQRLAADLPDQRPDRDRRGPGRAVPPRREREAPRRARPAGCAHRHHRPGRHRLRPHPRRAVAVRLGRPLDHRRAGRRRPPARAVRRCSSAAWSTRCCRSGSSPTAPAPPASW